MKALKYFVLFLGVCSSAYGQILGPILMNSGAIAGGHAALVNMGGVTASGVDSGTTDVQNFGICSSFIPSANSTVNSLNVWVDTVAGSGLWGTALYADNGNTPQGGAVIASTTSSAVPSTSAWATLTPAGIGTLTGGTKYWACFVTTSSTRTIGENAGLSGGGYNTCTSGDPSFFSTSVLGSPFASWPGTFPAATSTPAAFGQSNGCYSIYVQLSYTSSATYDLITASGGATDAVVNPSTVHFPPIAANQTLIVSPSFGGTFTLASVTDSASNTVTIRGSCPINIAPNGLSMCFASEDRPTVGVNAFTVTFSGIAHAGFMYCVVQGTAASSFDVVHYDAASTSSPVTSGATGTTAQATEFLVGALVIHAGSPPTCIVTGTNGWALDFYGGQTGTSRYGMAIFHRLVTNGPATYTLQATVTTGSGCGSASDELAGLAAFK